MRPSFQENPIIKVRTMVKPIQPSNDQAVNQDPTSTSRSYLVPKIKNIHQGQHHPTIQASVHSHQDRSEHQDVIRRALQDMSGTLFLKILLYLQVQDALSRTDALSRKPIRLSHSVSQDPQGLLPASRRSLKKNHPSVSSFTKNQKCGPWGTMECSRGLFFILSGTSTTYKVRRAQPLESDLFRPSHSEIGLRVLELPAMVNLVHFNWHMHQPTGFTF